MGFGFPSLLHDVQVSCGAHLASYTMGTVAVFKRVKRQGREADHSHPSSAEAKNGGAIHPLSLTSSLRDA
jgi:hypothetical protein